METKEILIVFLYLSLFFLVIAGFYYGFLFFIDKVATEECNELGKENCEYEKCKYDTWTSDTHKDAMITCLLRRELLDIS